jgi:dihydrofolate reductase
MGKIIVTEFVTLDNVMEDPGGAEGFKYGGWSFKVKRGEEGDKVKTEETKGTAALLLGHKTYDGFAEAWPKMEGEFADMFNGLPKYVVSQEKEVREWPGGTVTVLTGDFKEEMTKLKTKVDGNLVVHGSAMLTQGLLELGLIDQMNLMVYPTVLGAGKKLFADMEEKQDFRLTRNETIGDGVVLLVYKKA